MSQPTDNTTSKSSEGVASFLVPPYTSTVPPYIPTSSMVLMSHKFLQQLVDRYIDQIQQKTHIDIELVKQLTQIKPWVHSMTETSKERVEA